MEQILALRIKNEDNVATIFSDKAGSGETVQVRDHQGKTTGLVIRDSIPYGHKVAVADIPAGAPIVKYGEVIGAASKDIVRGDYVHIHNMDSLRGRGDLANS